MALLTMWLIVTIGFVCVYKLPGDPARMILGRQASEEALREFRLQAGLDRPLWRQYPRFVDRTIHLNLGDSLVYRRPVVELIRERSAATVKLVFFSLLEVITIAFIIPLLLRLTGSEIARNWLQRCSVALGIVPPYVLGVVILAILAGSLGWVSAIFEPARIRAWILPSLVLAAYPIAITMRLFENHMQCELRKLYVVRAKVMGFSHRVIVLREVLPNALTTALAAVANGLASFVTGTFFVEVIFGISGLGRLTYDAIGNKDIGLLAGLCIVFAVAITAISTTLDLAQLMIDPRLRGRHA